MRVWDRQIEDRKNEDNQLGRMRLTLFRPIPILLSSIFLSHMQA